MLRSARTSSEATISEARCAGATFALGAPDLDARLDGGLPRGAVHEVLADPGHSAAATGFALGLAGCALRDDDHAVWVRQEAAALETGQIHGPGLAAFGFDPARLLIVRLGTVIDALRAGAEAARCAAIGAVIIETTDTGQKIDLTATRRLKLAAEKSGVTLLVLRRSAPPTPNAAHTRWLVRAAAPQGNWGQVPIALALAPEQSTKFSVTDGATSACAQWKLVPVPNFPRFDITLLKHRAGIAPMRWIVEWNRDRRTFATALSQPLATVPVGRRIAA